ncbi:heme-binding protein [Bacillaceae bacterium]
MEIKKKPFLTQDMALGMIQAAVAKAQELQVSVNVAVVDDGGNLMAFLRMDGAPLMSGEIARNKAYTAVGFGIPTSAWYERIKDKPAVLHGIVHTEHMVIFGGGLPIRMDGHLVGGIGVSGASAEEDEACAQAGIAVLQKYGQGRS